MVLLSIEVLPLLLPERLEYIYFIKKGDIFIGQKLHYLF